MRIILVSEAKKTKPIQSQSRSKFGASSNSRLIFSALICEIYAIGTCALGIRGLLFDNKRKEKRSGFGVRKAANLVLLGIFD